MTERTPAMNPGGTAIRIAVLVLVAWGVAVAAWAPRGPQAARVAPPAEYRELLTRVDLRYRALLDRAGEMESTRAWTAYEWAAGAALERARLSGSFDDYAAADALLARAFEIAAGAGGPYLSRARLHYSLHRYDAALADLAAAERQLLLPDATRRQIAAIRADIAFHRGRYREALAGYRDNLVLESDPSDLFRLAYYEWQTGAYDRAAALLEQAAAASGDLDPQRVAFWHLQRGQMDLDRGRHAEAFAHFLDADAALPGWWLVQEHLAEVHTLEGRLDEAEAIYRAVIEETGSPEFMDAMAGIAAQRGSETEAALWIARARAGYERQLALLPEAAMGHALGHFLAYEPNDELVLALAERNHALRPGGEATLLLAQAELRADRLDEAADLISALLAGPWRSAELHATAATVYRLRGDTAAAEEQLAAMRGIDPGFAPYRLGRHLIGG